ncbi:MAG: heavy-metal-associated domain-containing protein [Luteimonas sp.]
MNKLLHTLTLLGAAVAASAAFADERTVTFAIDNMSCVTCPYIVKTSMAAVPGVADATVSFQAKTATVTFDDAKTTPDLIAAASTNAGYPAHPRQQGN